MKTDIHPTYYQSNVTCVCGNSFIVGSTKPNIRVDICAKCHPFFTGQQKLIDTLGRVERFQKSQQIATQKQAGLKPKKMETRVEKRPLTLREMLLSEPKS